jgi:hypothetical protein
MVGSGADIQGNSCFFLSVEHAGGDIASGVAGLKI